MVLIALECAVGGALVAADWAEVIAVKDSKQIRRDELRVARVRVRENMEVVSVLSIPEKAKGLP